MPVSSVQSTMQFVLAITIFELIVGTPVSAVIVKISCWFYNKMVLGAYDRAGVFGTPLPFDDDLYTMGTQQRRIKMVDPNAVPDPTWGTAVTVAFCAKFIQSIVGVGVIYFLLSRAAILGPPAPDIQKIGLLAMMVAGPSGFLSLAYLISRFLPTSFHRGMMLGVVHFTLSVLAGATFILITALFVPILNVAGGAR